MPLSFFISPRKSQNCRYEMKIATRDDDGDIVKCRWARKNENNNNIYEFDECADACEQPAGFDLVEVRTSIPCLHFKEKKT